MKRMFWVERDGKRLSLYDVEQRLAAGLKELRTVLLGFTQKDTSGKEMESTLHDMVAHQFCF